MSIILPEDLSEQLERIARQQHKTPEALVREWLLTYRVLDTPKKPRILNLGKGRMQMSDDFDDYLGDDFWFGEE